MKIIAPLLLLFSLLSGCGTPIGNDIAGLFPGKTNGIANPSPGKWYNFAQNITSELGSSFQIGTSPIMGYVYTAPNGSFRQGATVTLNYTVSGNPNYAVRDPSDTLPASITLFAWERGDNLTCQGGYVSYRMWNGARGSLTPGNHVISAVIDGNTWTNCFGKSDPQGFANLTNNLLGVGFTFGGANFYGHGVTSSPPVTFTINSYTVQ